MRKRRRHRGCGRYDRMAYFAVAFGLGLFLSLFLSVRFALFLAAITLIYIGVTCRS